MLIPKICIFLDICKVGWAPVCSINLFFPPCHSLNSSLLLSEYVSPHPTCFMTYSNLALQLPLLWNSLSWIIHCSFVWHPFSAKFSFGSWDPTLPWLPCYFSDQSSHAFTGRFSFLCTFQCRNSLRYYHIPSLCSLAPSSLYARDSNSRGIQMNLSLTPTGTQIPDPYFQFYTKSKEPEFHGQDNHN